MKTTKRSKMLLSSIAMLLVALVALGSATFAWYAIQRNVWADTVNVKAASADGLVISLDNTNWSQDVDLEKMGTTGASGSPVVLNPAKLTLGATGVTGCQYAEGASASASTKTGEYTSVTPASNGLGTYYVMDEIYVKSNSAKAGSVQASVTATGTTADSFIHFALVEDTGTTLDSVDASDLTSGSKTTFGTAQSYLANGQTTKHYYVVAWADGDDDDCFTNATAIANAIEWKVEFDLTDAAA